jgi:hypothetical protein
LSDREKIQALEEIVTGKKYIAVFVLTRCVFSLLVLRQLCLKHNFPQDILVPILHYVHALAVRTIDAQTGKSARAIHLDEFPHGHDEVRVAYKELLQPRRLIADSEIPVPQQGKVRFLFSLSPDDYSQVQMKGTIKGIPAFARRCNLDVLDMFRTWHEVRNRRLGERTEFDKNEPLSDIECDIVYDTEKGLEFYLGPILVFLYDNVYRRMLK